MSIPIATTTISVLRSDWDDADPYEAVALPTTIASGVRAVIGISSGSEILAGAEQEIVTFRLDCDPVDLQHRDQVEDESTGDVFDVVWARPRTGLGLDYTQAGLRQVEGPTGS